MITKNGPPSPVKVTISAGHPLLTAGRGLPTDPQVCLARIGPGITDDDGVIQVEINFEPAFLTIREAAQLLTISKRAVRELVQQGWLEVRQIDREVRIPWDSLVAFAEL